MSSQSVAYRYASALADVIIVQKQEALVRDELATWERMILSYPPLLEALTNPSVPYIHKAKVLNELIARTKVRPTTANFLRVLLRNQRLAELPQVNAKLDQVLDERSGGVATQLTPARSVADSIKRGLADPTIGAVAITRHDTTNAVLLSVAELESLVSPRSRTLDLLTDEFDEMLERMQTEESRKGMKAAFNASPAQLGRAAVKGARGNSPGKAMPSRRSARKKQAKAAPARRNSK